MPRYKLTLRYDGTDFCGWQKQEQHATPEALARIARPGHPLGELRDEGKIHLRTVQDVLERAVRQVVREPIVLMGASRTDAGVHAEGQVAAFTCTAHEERGRGWPLDRGLDSLRLAINSRLPDDVRVRTVEPAAHDFDPIRGATSKAYRYTIHAGRDHPLWDRRYVYAAPYALDARAMHEAAQKLVGEHDFLGFTAADHGRLTTVRTIFYCNVAEQPQADQSGPDHTEHEAPAQRITIDVAGSGFLYNMVRIIAGTLLEVGRGRLDPARIDEALATQDRTKAGPTLPPEGLRLEWIRYGGSAIRDQPSAIRDASTPTPDG
ncbi:MAG: tRNA pseudouridine synthase A [Phycisphaerales bacterium]|nr:MAG: tRNA pseudouridine synthase A [Phycisphaerales bacterium]